MSQPAPPRRWTLWLPLAVFAGFVILFLVGLLRPAEREVRSALIGAKSGSRNPLLTNQADRMRQVSLSSAGCSSVGPICPVPNNTAAGHSSATGHSASSNSP